MHAIFSIQNMLRHSQFVYISAHINFNYCTNKVFQSSHQLDYTIWYAQSEKKPSAARK